jgi:hypothetical protein
MPDHVSDLDRVVVTDAIREVMAWYAYYADHGEWAKLAQLFTPAATFTTYGPDGELYLDLTGPAAIEKTIAAGVGNARAIHHLFSYTTDVRSPTAASIVVQAMKRYLDDLDDGGVPAGRRVIAALGPNMLALAAERVGGVIPYSVTPDWTRRTRATVGDGLVIAPEHKVVLDKALTR